MLVAGLLAFLVADTSGNATREDRIAAYRRQRPITTPTLIQGDIAVSDPQVVTEGQLSAFVRKNSLHWPNGLVFYRTDTFDDDGEIEQMFTDEGLENITQAHTKIMDAVPCIRFKYCLSHHYTALSFRRPQIRLVNILQ